MGREISDRVVNSGGLVEWQEMTEWCRVVDCLHQPRQCRQQYNAMYI
jgi:hypothetical protein